MRGLLFTMMRLNWQVEQFKHTPDPTTGSFYTLSTIRRLVTLLTMANEGHLQHHLYLAADIPNKWLDCTSSTIDRDSLSKFGLLHWSGHQTWIMAFGAGNKINHGNQRLNASSVGVLLKQHWEGKEALNEDKFNIVSTPLSMYAVKYLVTLENLRHARIWLQRNRCCASCDSQFSPFAVENVQLIQTRNDIINKLQGPTATRFLKMVIKQFGRWLSLATTNLETFSLEHIIRSRAFPYLLLDGIFQKEIKGS